MRFNRFHLLACVAMSTLVHAECAKKEVGESVGPAPTTDPGPTVNPEAPDPQPTPTPKPAPRTLNYSGIYQANAAIDFTQSGALPGLESPALGLLANLHTQPGTALVNFGYAAGVDALNSIGAAGRTLLGAILDDKLKTLYMDNPNLDHLVTLIQNISQIAKTTMLLNSLAVHKPSADHAVVVDLQLTGAQFHFLNLSLMDTTYTTTVPMAQAAAAKATFSSGTLTPRPDPNLADADLTFGDATITVPLGDFLMQAFGAAIFQPLYGTSDFKTGFVDAIPCDSIAASGAQAVADSGNPLLQALFSQSVLKTVCVAGAGYLADQLVAQIQTLTVSGVTVSAGRGTLYDVSTSKPTADGQSDRVGDGAWTWTINSATVMSTFAGDRTGNLP
jgi:hypothetical protein